MRDDVFDFVMRLGGNQSFKDATFANCDKVTKSQHAFVHEFDILNSSRGIYINGPAGVGKTYAMQLIFNRMVEQIVNDRSKSIYWEKMPYWILMTKFLDGMRSFDNAQYIANVKNRAYNAHWLFIDDIGATTKTDWAIDQIYMLLEHRIQNQLPTFITSNLSMRELGEFYNDRIASRVAALCYPVKFEGDDLRIQKMKQDYNNLVKSREK